MGNIVSVIFGVVISSVLILIPIIITIIYCYKRSHHNQEQEDSLHTVIRSKNIRSDSTISIINDGYHNNMTLLASPRRLAILELQQQRTLTHENSTFNSTELLNTEIMRF